MADDSSQIWVGEDKIGLRGLKEAIEEIARSDAERTDEEIQDALLERLSEKNYIASSARKEYGEAFLREFRKFLGQPYEEALGTSLRIVVLGPGCSQCNRLEQTVKQAVDRDGPSRIFRARNRCQRDGQVRLCQHPGAGDQRKDCVKGRRAVGEEDKGITW